MPDEGSSLPVWSQFNKLKLSKFLKLRSVLLRLLGFLVWCWIFVSLFLDIRSESGQYSLDKMAVLVTYFVASLGICLFVIRQRKTVARTKGEYQLFINALKQPSIIHREGKVVDVNDYALTFLGASSRDEIIGAAVMNLVHPDYRSLAFSRIKSLERGVSTDIVVQKWLTLSGEVRDVEVVGLPVRYHGAVATQVMLRDITEQKATESSLKSAVELMQMIEENIEDFVCVVAADGSLQYVSSNTNRVLGMEFVTNRGIFATEIVHPDDLEALRTDMKTCERFRRECRVQSTGDQIIVLEVVGTPLQDETGNPTGIVMVSRNVTERKQTEELLRRSEKLSAVGELAAGVAHEIRNPLTAIQGFVQILKSKADEDTVRYFDIMLGELQRIHLTIGELLILARPQAPQFQVRDVALIVQEVLSFMNSQALLHNVIFEFVPPLSVPGIRCDENQLKQVFINVVKNAIEAMPDGGKLAIQLDVTRSELLLQFTDTGVGIPPEHLAKLGQPFYTTKKDGTGLGTMVSQRIIQSHGGTLKFQSTVGTGTTVQIGLPIIEGAGQASHSEGFTQMVNAEELVGTVNSTRPETATRVRGAEEAYAGTRGTD